MSGWTPGPWRVVYDRGEIWGTEATYIEGVQIGRQLWSCDDIAELDEHDAQLIAAAPEMAELLGNILNDLEQIVNPMMVTLGLHPLDLNTNAAKELLSKIRTPE